MRINDINTTDIYAAKAGRPVRIIQLGPTKGGTLWTRRSPWGGPAKGLNLTTHHGTHQRSTGYSSYDDVGHLAIEGCCADDIEYIRAVEIPDFSRFVHEQWYDQADALDAKVRYERSDHGLRLRAINTRSLRSWEDHVRRDQQAQAEAVKRQEEYDAACAEYDELFAPVALMLANNGMSPVGIKQLREYNPERRLGAVASVRVPLKFLAAIAERLQKGQS